ncbi:alpha/beta hydrolase [Microvirga sp. W0021]|uniref:Alpha/beta hydrolase n=1 Tax=Hohaiivirga grylli TaxID=3133970 RepID=A0ABV0BGB3_9HYPH
MALFLKSFIALCIACIGASSAFAQEEAPAFASNPTVLVLTTRLQNGEPIVKPWFTGQRGIGLSFAEAEMTSTGQSVIGKVASAISGEWSVENVDHVDRKEPAKAFANAAMGKDILLYVHGYRETFESATVSAIQLSQGIKFRGATAVFTWPSAAATLDYGYDRESAMWSRDALLDALVAAAKSNSGGRINIVAHSMGTLLTLETLRMFRAEGGELLMSRIGAIVLASPDIDIDLFTQAVERLGPDAKKITVISSTKDRALALSSQLAGGIVRAGAANRDRLEELGVRVADASAFGSGIINHDLFLSNKDVQQVIRRAIDREK